MTQVYNQNTLVGWDGKTNIERFMEHVTKYCDALVAFDDGSTDGSRDIITSFSGDIEIEIPSNKVNTPDLEGYHRAISLEHCRRLNADWVLCLDVDEVLEKSANIAKLRTLLEGLDDDIDGIELPIRDMWRTDRYLRVDGDWSSSAGIRLFKLSDKLSYDITQGYRTALAPGGINNMVRCAMRIIHFGYSSDKEIVSKYKRFKLLGVDLLEDIKDNNIRLCDIDTDWLYAEPAGPCIEAYEKQIHEVLDS